MSMQIGIIGAGVMGTNYAHHLNTTKKAELVAVCDLRKEAVENLARELGVKGFVDYNEMLDQVNLDVVLVATPDAYHREPAIAAIQKVPHLIIEKPMATTVEDAKTILEAAEKNNVSISILFSNRFFPLDRIARHLFRKGLIGELIHSEIRFDDNISVPFGMWGDRSAEFSKDSTPAQFLLSHTTDWARFMFSPAEVSTVQAISNTRVVSGSADVYDSLLTFDNGGVLRMKSEWVKHMDTLIEIYVAFTGTRGTIVYNKEPGFGVKGGLRLTLKDTNLEELEQIQKELEEDGLLVKIAQAGSHAYSPYILEAYPEENGVFLWLEGLERCIDAIETNNWQDIATGIDGLRQVEVVTAIEEAARTNSVIKLKNG